MEFNNYVTSTSVGSEETFSSMVDLFNEDVSFYSAVIAIVLNLLLLPLIFFKSSPFMGSYKYLLFIYTLQSVIYSSVVLAVAPQFYVSQGNIVLYSASGNFSSFLGSCAILLFICCWTQIVVVISLCFLHRSDKRSWFKKKPKILVILLVDIVFTALLAINVIWGCWPTEWKTSYMEADFREVTGFDIRAFPYLGGPEWIGDSINISTFSTSALFGVYSVFSTILVGTIISKMIPSFIKLMKIGNSSKLGYQKRIFALLLFQTFFPLVFNFGPGVVAHLCTIFRMNLGKGIATFTSLIGIAQCIDPFVTFIMVTEYRTTVLGWIRRNGVAPVSSQNLPITLQDSSAI